MTLKYLLLRRTPPGVRELKHPVEQVVHLVCSRTPPGVRELKQLREHQRRLHRRRTPPGVRELKQMVEVLRLTLITSHPLREFKP